MESDGVEFDPMYETELRYIVRTYVPHLRTLEEMKDIGLDEHTFLAVGKRRARTESSHERDHQKSIMTTRYMSRPLSRRRYVLP